jgi:hypothetical protein
MCCIGLSGGRIDVYEAGLIATYSDEFELFSTILW